MIGEVTTDGIGMTNEIEAGLDWHAPPEWAKHLRTWMCWPCRTEAWGSVENLARARNATAEVARAISRFESVIVAARPQDAADAARSCADTAEIFEVALDDSWARDCGPTFLSGAGRAGVAWRFNAWGEKYQPYENDRAFAARVLERAGARIYRAPLVCEGGAIHFDGEGTLLATEQCLLNSNRNPDCSIEEVEGVLTRYTGSRCIIWLGSGFADEETDGHVDNIACFAAPGRVILGVPASRSHPDWGPVMEASRRLSQARDARGRQLEVVEMPQPQKIRFDWRARPLAASYVNFYLVNGGVVMPSFDDPADSPARAVLADCFPGRIVVQVDALDIVQGGGGIHCITQQEPA
jgi:agmatine deiminase